MVFLNDIIELQRQARWLREKMDMLDSYNRGPRFGQLWINNDAIELSREDYNDVAAVLRARIAKKIEAIEAQIVQEIARYN
jgi:hypothetical protein